MINHEDIDKIVIDIKNTKKYKYICHSTIRQMVLTGIKETGNLKKAVKYAKKKLHHIAALYLGDPDYDRELIRLKNAIGSNENDKIKEVCRDIMSCHISTGERLEIIKDFYSKIFEITGKPSSILDIASGLNPLSFYWMDLPEEAEYYAYEINEKRVDFLNSFFSLLKKPFKAKFQDVLVDMPIETAHTGFLLKMVHCFEIRKKGSSMPLMEKLKVKHLVVSFPARNITQKRSIGSLYENMFFNIIKGKAWSVEKIDFHREVVFCIKKC